MAPLFMISVPSLKILPILATPLGGCGGGVDDSVWWCWLKAEARNKLPFMKKMGFIFWAGHEIFFYFFCRWVGYELFI